MNAQAGAVRITPFAGGRRLSAVAALAGAVGLALTALGGFLDAQRALMGYLVAFVYWTGIAVAALILVGALHASKANWAVVVRRFVESVPQSLLPLAILFIPIAAGMRHVFPWVDPSGLPEHVQHLVHAKHAYLNPEFFVGRAIFYFVFWIVVAGLLRSWSVRQDSAGGVALTVWQRRLGTGALPFLALTMSFASFDWMMSLDPVFFSTIFGVYWWAGSFLAVFAVTIIAGSAWRDDPSSFGALLNVDHFHSLGKFLLAFVSFWAYIAFSQFMLIWIANIPEEVPWYIIRTSGGWMPVFAFLAIFHFFIPFFLLLSRDLKRNPRKLSWLSAYLLVVHYVDLYWLMMPRLHPEGPRLHFTDLTSLVGIGGIAIAWTLFRMRGTAAVPAQDPYIEASLRYQPQ
jgi:hypothetical protein